MSFISDRIAEIIAKHQYTFDGEIHPYGRHGCQCGEWFDTGPSLNRVRHNYGEHLAEAIETTLGLSEKTKRVQCKDANCAWCYGRGCSQLKRRFATDWETL